MDRVEDNGKKTIIFQLTQKDYEYITKSKERGDPQMSQREFYTRAILQYCDIINSKKKYYIVEKRI